MDAESAQSLLHGVFLAVLLIALIAQYFLLPSSTKSSRVAETKKGGDGSKDKIDNRVVLDPAADATYLVNRLRPESTPLQILYIIATTPDTVAVTSKHVALAADMREKKRAHLAEKERGGPSHKSMDDLFNDDGWAEDDADDPAAAAAKKAKEEKEKEATRLAKATGKDVTDFNKMMLEGVDDGVLGQEWVVKNLTKLGAWPPPSLDKAFVAGENTFDFEGKMVGPLDHPGVKRALIMTMGRLHAKELNTHPDLMAAGPKGLIDPTYFQATMEYRQRVGQVLEGALKMACTLRSYRLARSVLDAIVMFKIGLADLDGKEQKKWFDDLMTKQYGPSGKPKLVIQEKFLGVPTPEPEKEDDGESKDEAAKKKDAEKKKLVQQIMQTRQVTTTDDKMALEMQITRQHAESFTKEKLAMCQKQGIPPQIALQSYREAWFILVRARGVNDDGSPSYTWDGALGDAKYPGSKHFELLREKKEPLYEMLGPETLTAFTRELASPMSVCENRIVIGWPFVITNVAQKVGKVKIHLPPVEPGRYEFTVSIVSQEFLGVGEEFSLFVDVAKGVEKKKEDKDEDEGDSENKKDK